MPLESPGNGDTKLGTNSNDYVEKSGHKRSKKLDGARIGYINYFLILSKSGHSFNLICQAQAI